MFWHYLNETSWNESFKTSPSNIISCTEDFDKTAFSNRKCFTRNFSSAIYAICLLVVGGNLSPFAQRRGGSPHFRVTNESKNLSAPLRGCTETPRAPRIEATLFLGFCGNFCSCLTQLWRKMRILELQGSTALAKIQFLEIISHKMWDFEPLEGVPDVTPSQEILHLTMNMVFHTCITSAWSKKS